MTDTKGRVVAVNGNLISVAFDGTVSLNEVGYVSVGDKKLKSEVIRIQNGEAQLQVFEMTKGIQTGDEVFFTNELLSIELGPGLLGQVFDGLQNPLPELAEQAGYFLERGVYLDPLPDASTWSFTPIAKAGDTVKAGSFIGEVPEGTFKHKIMVPFTFLGNYTVVSVKEKGDYALKDTIAVVKDARGVEHNLSMSFNWPVKRSVDCYAERLMPTDTLTTKIRLIDTFFPVAKGGTYCIPGPFGAGKTVLQ
ncbi:MAG TPA: V-type ATP synthase subunit A, partial [Treponemataceae bacterium]|nr:V-type ATP synthase subunit A [Treponemataceae bacterium]